MIHYSLRCAGGHAFDGWFASSAAFERQRDAGLLACPACGASEVNRALMAPALGRGAAVPAASEPQPPSAGPEPQAPSKAPNVALLDEGSQKMRELMRAMREAVLAQGTNVGRAFPEEARKIHYGEAEARGIYGEADRDEARALLDEGIAILPLPAPDQTN